MKLLNSIFLISTIIVLVIFSGNKTRAIEKQEKPKQVIKIGLLVSANYSVEARNAAEIAIEEANNNVDFEGYQFQLITRSLEGPWGTGSKEAVDLVFNEKVWAILGSHDGRNAHLVEQVIAKTQIPFVSAWSGDPTLSQAFVPWFFNCVPNYNQQAILLIKEIYQHQKLHQIITVSDSEYDSEVALKSFLKEVKQQNRPEPIQLSYKESDLDFTHLVNQIKNTNSEGIVIFGQATSTLKLIEMLRMEKIEKFVFGTLSIMGENPLKHFNLSDYEGVIMIHPGNWFEEKENAFGKNFENKYNWKPGAVGAFAYDGINTIIESIKKAGFERNNVKQTLVNTRYNGITGQVSFDINGNRLGVNKLIEVRNGIPETIKN